MSDETMPPCRHCPHFEYRDHVNTTTGLPVMERPPMCPAATGEGYDFAVSEAGLCCDCGADDRDYAIERDATGAAVMHKCKNSRCGMWVSTDGWHCCRSCADEDEHPIDFGRARSVAHGAFCGGMDGRDLRPPR